VALRPRADLRIALTIVDPARFFAVASGIAWSDDASRAPNCCLAAAERIGRGGEARPGSERFADTLRAGEHGLFADVTTLTAEFLP
jgi:hypothetical protein